MTRVGNALMRLSAVPGHLAAWLVIAITAAIVVAVVASLLRLSTLASWGITLPILGSELTLTGLSEMQWHLFAIMVMFGGASALSKDRHVRVDLVYAHLSERGRSMVNILGDLLFLLPFAGLVFWLSLRFVELAYRSGEASDYGGLTDRYLIKAVVPVGCALLFLAGLGRILANVGRLLSRPNPDPS